jgi:hypothetical protein
MKNLLAITLKDAAEKNMARYSKAVKDDPQLDRVVKSDYEDLMSIVGMIENGEDKKTVARAMWNLDTAVRDVIPDSVYDIYNN